MEVRDWNDVRSLVETRAGSVRFELAVYNGPQPVNVFLSCGHIKN